MIDSNKLKRINHFFSGSALPYALVVLTVVSILFVSVLQFVSSQMTYSLKKVNQEKAFQISEAGIYFYRWYLAHSLSGKTAQQINDFWTGSPLGVNVPYETEYFDPESGAVGHYRIKVDPPEPNSTIVFVTSEGWTDKEPNLKKTIRARFRRPSWSEFMVLANDFMRFGDGTEVYGKIHSNQGVRFDGLAHNVVSSSLKTVNDPDHDGGDEYSVHTHTSPTDPLPPVALPNRPDVFSGGRQFPVASVDFNGLISDLSYMKEQATSGKGVYFDSSYGRHIILKTDGTMDVRRVTSYDETKKNISKESSATTYAIPESGIVFVENNIWLEGAVKNKKVTIVAANMSGGSKADVYLGMNNLKYSNFDGSDIIGVIAQQNISVIEGSLDNLQLDGAFLAQSGRIGRDNFYDVKSSITINGSMATNVRYGFRYTDGHGYQLRTFNFDNNLLYYPPPYFPTGSEYAIDLWEEI